MSLTDRLRKVMSAHPQEHKPPLIDPASSTWQGAFGGPGVPLVPLYAKSPARRYDYQFAVNNNVTPRSEYQGFIPSFPQLRAFYALSSILKSAVTFRTQQIVSNSWNVKVKAGANVEERAADHGKKLLQRPDPLMGHNFEAWCGMILEAAWVHDAVTIVLKRSVLGNPLAMQVTDGCTIKPLIDYDTGGFPAPPEPAYLQIIKGAPYSAYTSDEMLYHEFRPRDWCIYGQSRVEKILEIMTIYQLYEAWTGDFFTQGNLPEVAYLTDPAQANLNSPKQLRKWQKVLDLLHGRNVSRRRVHLVPPFVKAIQQMKEFTFDKALPDWFIRPLCVEFGIPAFMFVSETNRATATEISEVLHEPAIASDLMSFKRFVDDIFQAFGMVELEFEWVTTPDYSEKRVRGVVLLCTPFTDGTRIMTIDEARDHLDLDPLEQDAAVAAENAPTAPDPNAEASETDAGQLPAPISAVAPAPERKVAALKAIEGGRPKSAGRRYAGTDKAIRARLAMGFAPVVAKRLRQRRAEVEKMGIELARSRMLQVKNAKGATR
jgi:hypothetical protein